MTFIPHRECPLQPRSPWYKRLLSRLTLGAYLPPAPPACQCILCWRFRERVQEFLDSLEEGHDV